jgi:hypothetical protein
MRTGKRLDAGIDAITDEIEEAAKTLQALDKVKKLVV